MIPNRFEIAAAWRGSITPKQERALNGFVTRLGRRKFARYRALAGVGNTPIPRLSSKEAYELISVIREDLDGER